MYVFNWWQCDRLIWVWFSPGALPSDSVECDGLQWCVALLCDILSYLLLHRNDDLLLLSAVMLVVLICIG